MKRLTAIQRVLVSTYDPRNLTDLIAGLLDVCPELQIFSTGLTYSHLLQFLGPQRAVKHLQSVEEFTGQVATEPGVPRTLDWRIAMGILFDEDSEKHRDLAYKYGLQPIDLVVCNVQPFGLAAARTNGTVEAACQLIEIERPNLIRMAVRALHRAAVLVSPNQYADFMAALRQNGGSTDIADRVQLAISAMGLLRQLDQDTTAYLSNLTRTNSQAAFANFLSPGAEVPSLPAALEATLKPVEDELEAAEVEAPELEDDGLGDVPLEDFERKLVEKKPEAADKTGGLGNGDIVDPDEL